MVITYCASRKLQERGLTPPKESYSQAFSKENRTAAGWLSGESQQWVPKVKGNRDFRISQAKGQ